jgi:hypothetical protein
LEFIKPDVRVDIDDVGRKKRLQLPLVELTVDRFDLE